jgi:hypothetical protein
MYMKSFDKTKQRLTPKQDLFTQIANWWGTQKEEADGKPESAYPAARGSQEK